jgi:hypothetical protein
MRCFVVAGTPSYPLNRPDIDSMSPGVVPGRFVRTASTMADYILNNRSRTTPTPNIVAKLNTERAMITLSEVT